MLAQVKLLTKSNNLQKANQTLVQWIRSPQFIEYGLSATTHHPFYIQALHQSSLVIVPDDADNALKDEQAYQTIIGVTFFLNHVNTIDDVLCHLIHSASHQLCDQFWHRSPVEMSQFTPVELDILEEVYNQRIAYQIAPTIHPLFPKSIINYDAGQHIVVQDARRSLQSLFNAPPGKSCVELNLIHLWLYQNDPFDQHTFDYFFSWCATLLKKKEIKSLFEQYH